MREARRLESGAEVAVEEIVVRDRMRPVSEAGVAALLSSIEDLGHITDPIQLRRVAHQDNALVLMAGGHRLEAARRLGWDTVRADIWDCTDDWARLIEADDNLAGAELTALDTAIFLAERKDVYERLHPESRHGGDRRSDQADLKSVWSFAAATAEKFGIGERQVRKLVAAGKTLEPRDREVLRQAPRPVSLADLQALSKVTDAEERAHVVLAVGGGNAKSVAAARAAWKRQGSDETVEPASEAALRKLMTVWSRAPRALKRRLVQHYHDEFAELVAETDPRGGEEA